jgi:hypothetical protein
MAFVGLKLYVALIAAVIPLAATAQSGRQPAPPRTDGVAPVAPNGTRQPAHDRNWLKKQMEKRYNGTLTSPKKSEKPAKPEEKPTEKY